MTRGGRDARGTGPDEAALPSPQPVRRGRAAPATPIKAYKGDAPYIFVSYSHVDSTRVLADVAKLDAAGYRIWYDEGIDAGNEWPEEIAKALSGCALFLVYVSPDAAASRNVRNEIHFALNKKKTFLAVHLAETELPEGLELRMGDIQAILRWRMSVRQYDGKLEESLPAEVRGEVPSRRRSRRAQARSGGAVGSPDARGEERPTASVALAVLSRLARAGVAFVSCPVRELRAQRFWGAK